MSLSPGILLPFGFILLLLFFHTLFGGLFQILLRSGFSLFILHLLAQFPFLSCFSLGINLFNALVMGILGIPGFALLLFLRWITQFPA